MYAGMPGTCWLDCRSAVSLFPWCDLEILTDWDLFTEFCINCMNLFKIMLTFTHLLVSHLWEGQQCVSKHYSNPFLVATCNANVYQVRQKLLQAFSSYDSTYIPWHLYIHIEMVIGLLIPWFLITFHYYYFVFY